MTTTKFDVTDIPVNFICGDTDAEILRHLGDDCASISSVYNEFCSLLQTNMIRYLPCKRVTLSNGGEKHIEDGNQSHGGAPWSMNCGIRDATHWTVHKELHN